MSLTRAQSSSFARFAGFHLGRCFADLSADWVQQAITGDIVNHPFEIFVLTRLTISPEGHVVAENIGATFDVYLAEAHRAYAIENDFERHRISDNWFEDAERSSVVAVMREFRQIVEEMQATALR